MARLLLGVSGGIAAYKAVELTRLAIKSGHGVRVLMTPAAQQFVGTATFEGITGAPVLVGEFDPDPARGVFPGDPVPAHAPIGHLAVAENADAYLVAPASADILARLAAGICDGMVTTSFVGCAAPRIVAPAMNDRMWADAAVQANVTALRARGVTVIEPDEGDLASRGEHGRGRLPDPAALLRAVEDVLGLSAPSAGGGPWSGRRVLITAGGTREPIDAVRFVGNRSSGRMGFALAGAAQRRGAEVALVAANVDLPTPAGVDRVDVSTAAEMHQHTEKLFADAEVLVMTAAVADYRPAKTTDGKIDKSATAEVALELVPNPDILAGLSGQRHNGQVLVGFAAEHGPQGVERARGKLQRKDLDAIVVNDISQAAIGFESDRNEVVVVRPGGETHLPLAEKSEIAEQILDELADLLPG
ncbi:MAG: bifunctional phosphopantothenoylcysteine decarboxylase/phosphopantothenate--cysteine ligase CoaBC [Solirubrobacterales bacterium]